MSAAPSGATREYNDWVVGERLRHYTKEMDGLTVPDFLEHRYYDDSTNNLRIVTALAIVLSAVVYIMGQIVALGKLGSFLLGWPHLWSVVVGTAVVLMFTAIGGHLAVVWTDFSKDS